MENLIFFDYMKNLLELNQSRDLTGMDMIKVFKLAGIPQDEVDTFNNWFERIRVIVLDKNKSISEKARVLGESDEQILKEYKLFCISKMIHDKQLPKNLFKYKVLSPRTFEMLDNQTMWIANYDTFNDAFEGLSPFPKDFSENDVLKYKKYIENKYNNSKQVPLTKLELDNFTETIEASIKSNMDDTKATCFTISNDNNLMWSHYADGSRGICLEFDISYDLEFFDFILPIQYVDKIPETKYLKGSYNFPVIETFFTKQNVWDYEKEYRLLKLSKVNKYKFDSKSLRSIIFGLKTEENEKQKYIELIKNKYPHCEIKQCKYNEEDSFSYDIVDIN